MAKGSETLASIAYTRNKDIGVTKATDKGLPGEEKATYTYDENSRLTKAEGAAYAYDAANDLTKAGSNTYAYNAADQLETDTVSKKMADTYTYNEVGQRTKTSPASGPAINYGYDQAGNLTSISRSKEGEVPAIEDSYAYNGEGLRTSETISGSTSYLAWDAAEELPLILANGTYSFIYGPGDVPIEQVNNSSGVVSYLHRDQEDSTRLLTGEKGEVTGAYSYSAYGEATGHTGSATTPLGYDGQYTSSDTGLIYLRARVYDPGTGQFLSVDALKAISGEPYGYTDDNPLNYGDATGLLFGIELRSWEEAAEGVAGWGDTLTFGATKWARERLGDENVDTCSAAYQAGGYAGVATTLLIPGEDDLEAAAHVWPETAEEMDEMLGIEGTRVPDGPTTPGRNKVTWEPNAHTKITFEQHPYDQGAPDSHTGPHWHLDTPAGSHERYFPGEPIPGY